MKVCTDACLFGALLPTGYNHILDIGTGTGLLSLMMAQKNPTAIIEAVEIDNAAAQQATENFNASPWKERMKVFHSDVLNLDRGKIYDCIISNPPFFEGDLQSAEPSKNNAKHNSSLRFQQLIKFVSLHLKTDGCFAVLLPYHRVDYFIKEAVESALYLKQQILVKQTEGHDFFRGILFFSSAKVQPVYSEMEIKNKGQYTAAFSSALKDFYLSL